MNTEAPDPVPASARRFDRVATAYARGRPEYPAVAVRAFTERLGLSGTSVVLDLAAGTGKLTRSFQAAVPARLIAVEPSASMRAEFYDAVPSVPVLSGTAEAIPVGAGTADAVVVGQAFHWFRAPEALREIARVLRPGGGLGIFYNNHDTSVPFVARFRALLRSKLSDTAPRHEGVNWSELLTTVPEFAPFAVERFRTTPELTVPSLVELALSRSSVSELAPGDRARFEETVRRFLDEDPESAGRSSVRYAFETEVHWTRRA